MALSTVQLESLLRRNPITKRYFIGVYPSCIYPRSRKKTYCFITNTDDHEEGGEHWNGFFVRDKTLYFFDSFGRSPNDDTLPHSYRDIVRVSFNRFFDYGNRFLRSKNVTVDTHYDI